MSSLHAGIEEQAVDIWIRLRDSESVELGGGLIRYVETGNLLGHELWYLL